MRGTYCGNRRLIEVRREEAEEAEEAEKAEEEGEGEGRK
jgi:hypothetical protein